MISKILIFTLAVLLLTLTACQTQPDNFTETKISLSPITQEQKAALEDGIQDNILFSAETGIGTVINSGPNSAVYNRQIFRVIDSPDNTAYAVVNLVNDQLGSITIYVPSENVDQYIFVK